MAQYDAVVVGAGPNGLAAAVRIAQAGRSVLVVEAATTVGGGARTQELTLPGFRHDVCSAVHPLAVSSPFFQSLPLAEHGLEFIFPPVACAHPLDGGRAAILTGSVDETADRLGGDGDAYRRLFGPFSRYYSALAMHILRPLVRVPTHPIVLTMGRYGARGALGQAQRSFSTEDARGLWAGLAAHSFLSLDAPLTSGVALMLGAAGHVHGWPIVRGGSQAIVDALASLVGQLGGEIVTEMDVQSIDDLPEHRVALFDTSTRALADIAGDRLPGRYRRRLRRFRLGPGVFKVDYALSAPVPWSARECSRAGTVHVGGSLEEVAVSEATVAGGGHPEKPFVLVAQPSLFDDSRAPDGQHVLWAYCHVPVASNVDMTDRIEAQIDRFAPGFRDLVLARSLMSPADLEAYNANNIGGDISGGAFTLAQTIRRPSALRPYATPARGIYLCSASTPPGAGVHGMCGYWAAEAVLRRELR